MNNWNGEHCQKCSKPYRMGYDVFDEIWNLVTQKKYNLLCIDCFDEMAKEKNVEYVAKVYWAGFGELFFPEDINGN